MCHRVEQVNGPYFRKPEIFGHEDHGCFDMTMEWGEFKQADRFTPMRMVAPFY